MRSSIAVDIYASPTLDHVSGSVRPGGPGYYVALAALALEQPKIRLRLYGCGSPDRYTSVARVFDEIRLEPHGSLEFAIEVRGDGIRALRVLSECVRPFYHGYSGDIAIAAPVYHDISLAMPCRLARSYRVAVLDIQGFTRVGAHAERSPMMVNHVDCLGEVTVRASSDDLPLPGAALHALPIDVLTFNGRAIAVFTERWVTLIKPERRIPGEPVGAGDVYNLFLALGLYEGLSLEEASIAAHYATLSFLEGRALRVYDPYQALDKARVKVTRMPVGSLVDALTLAAYGDL